MTDFEPAFTREDAEKAMKASSGWDVSAKICIVVMTKTKGELMQSAIDDPDAFITIAETLREYADYCGCMKELADHAFAHVMLAGNGAFGQEVQP